MSEKVYIFSDKKSSKKLTAENKESKERVSSTPFGGIH